MFRNAFLVVLLSAALPLGVAAVWFSAQSSSSREVTLQLHREVAGLTATTVARHLDVLGGRLEFLRQFYPDLARSPVPPAAAERLQRALRLNPDFLAVALVDGNNRELRRWLNARAMRSLAELYRAGEPARERAAQTRRPASALGALAEAPALITAEPVGAERFLYVAVSLEGLWNELNRHRIGATGLTVLATGDGQLLPLPGRTLPRVDPASLRRLFEAADRGWSAGIPSAEGPYLGMFERVPSEGLSDWYALTLQPRAEAALSGYRVALVFGLLAGLAGALAWAGAALIGAPLSAGLGELGRSLEALGRGDFAAAAAAIGPAELRALAPRLAQVAARLRERELALEGRAAEEKAKVETLVCNIPDGIVMTNLRGEVLTINAPAMETLGVRPEDVTQQAKGLFGLIRQDQLRESVKAILDKRALSEVVELPMAGPEGPVSRCYRTKVALFSAAGSGDKGVLLMMRDITAERELTQMKEEFFHSVAHDLRAPIFAIQGYLRLLEKGVQPEARLKGYFDAIYQSCDKLTLFIQDILDSARLESGQLKLGVTAVEPGAFLRRVQRLFGAVAAEKGIGLELKNGSELPATFDADERLLERVFSNLVANALKVTPKGGRITLAASRSGPAQIEFSVADTGPGIPADKRGLLFEKFSQLGSGAARRGGYGLGLNICRKIVELHKGELWVESEEGKGTQFVFRMPVQQIV